MTRTNRLARRVAFGFVAIGVFAATMSANATASTSPVRQTTPVVVDAGPLRLVSQNTWLQKGDDVGVRFTVGDVADRKLLEVVVAIYPRVTTRSAFQENLAGIVRGSPLGNGLFTSPLAELTPDTTGAYTVTIPVQDATNIVRGQVRISREGVYPVRIEARTEDGTSIGRITTHVVAVPTAIPSAELGVLTVLGIGQPVSVRPDGSIEPVSAATAQTVADISRTVIDHPNTVLLDVVPAFLEAVSGSETIDGRDVTAGLALASTSAVLLQHSFVDLPANYLGDPAFGNEFTRHELAGRTTLEDILSTPTSLTRTVRNGLSAAAFTAYAGSGAQRFVVGESVVSRETSSLTPASPVQIAIGAEQTSPAVVADSAASKHLAPSADPVLAGQNLLAELAVIWLERPSAPRAITLLSDSATLPDPITLQTFLSGLVSSPTLKPISEEELFALGVETNDDESPVVLALSIPELPASDLADLLRTRSNITSYSLVIGESTPVITSLDRRLLLAASASYTVEQRSPLIQGIRNDIESSLAGIRLPEDSIIRLTARTGEIPITISNTTGGPVRVVLELQSDRVSFPNGNRIELFLEEEISTERVAVEALSSGEFRVVARLQAPDGALTIDSSTVTLRSTGASWVGFAITGLAGLVLATWWTRQFVRNRLRKRQ
jgi:hypothetical protein